MTHTEESLMALADERWRTQWLLDHAEEHDDTVKLSTDAGNASSALRFAIREVLAERDKVQQGAVALFNLANKHLDRAEKAEAECERLRKELEKQLLLKMKEKP